MSKDEINEIPTESVEVSKDEKGTGKIQPAKTRGSKDKKKKCAHARQKCSRDSKGKLVKRCKDCSKVLK